jgi:PadR family transcriptional regulator, regulatory protein PadR
VSTSKTLLHGTLEALVLKTLSHGPLHGYAIARWIERRTNDALQIEEGSLYPALYRLESRGLLRSEWGTSELGRRAKFYALTPKGRARLAAEVEAWSAFSSAVTEVLAG